MNVNEHAPFLFLKNTVLITQLRKTDYYYQEGNN